VSAAHPAPGSTAARQVELERVEFAVPRVQSSPRRRASTGPRTYTPDEIIAAIKRWVVLYGEPPAMIDWEPSRARRTGQIWRAERSESGEWPSARMVTCQFAGFNAAVEAAGLRPRPAPSRKRGRLSGPHAIVDAMTEWTRRYGDVPTYADWDPARARRLGQNWRIARYHLGDWPSARSVALHFGSFATAAAAAGLVARRPGLHHDDRQGQRAANREVVARARASTRVPGHEDLADALRAVARARTAENPVALHAALIDLAGSALAWAELAGSG
jgi:hypothetical protein